MEFGKEIRAEQGKQLRSGKHVDQGDAGVECYYPRSTSIVRTSSSATHVHWMRASVRRWHCEMPRVSARETNDGLKCPALSYSCKPSSGELLYGGDTAVQLWTKANIRRF